VGKIPIDVREMHIDMMSFCAHKMYGPKGVGALFIRGGEPRVRLVPQMDGGGHERGMRSGTLNVTGIAGFGKAAEIARDEMGDDALRTSRLRDQLVDGFLASLDDLRVNGNPDRKLPHNASITFERAPADSLIMAMRDIAVSAGSACSSAQPEPSHVLRAIGLSGEEAAATIRFGLGRFTEQEEIEYTIRRVTEEVRSLREKAHHPVHIH
jgi:cysteine desulfurase